MPKRKAPVFLSVSQAADDLKLTRARVLALIDKGKGKLKATKVGRDYIIQVEDLEAFKKLDRPAHRPRRRE